MFSHVQIIYMVDVYIKKQKYFFLVLKEPNVKVTRETADGQVEAPAALEPS